jgi:nucleoside-diphosphate-sugar epimerase
VGKTRVLLVGGAGTLGFDILSSLSTRYDFFVLDDFSDSNMSREEVKNFAQLEIASASDLMASSSILQSFQPQVIVYLATSLSANQTIGFQSNLQGMKVLLECATLHNQPKVIFIQSFLTRKAEKAISESSAIQANDSYSVWKLATELLLKTYEGRHLTIVLGSVTSPRLNVGAIPAFTRNILNRTETKLTNSFRDYLSVNSFLDALRIAIEEDIPRDSVVIGSGASESTEELFHIVANELHLSDISTHYALVEPKPGDPKRIQLDSSWFQATYNWEPKGIVLEEVRRVIHHVARNNPVIRLHHEVKRT